MRKTTQGKQCHTREPLESLVPAPPQPCILQGDEPDGAGEGCPAVVGRAACIWLGLRPQECLPPAWGPGASRGKKMDFQVVPSWL